MAVFQQVDATPFILCADDYGLAPGVSRGIRELIEAGVLSATGCMTLSPFWPAEAPALKRLEHRADIGLHLTLTDHRPLGRMPKLAPLGKLPGIGALLTRCLARRIDRHEVTAEISRQLDAFEQHFGRAPDFIDGHHHVHQLPVVRSALLHVVERRYGRTALWLRSCFEPMGQVMARGVDTKRALIITQLGRPLDRALNRGAMRCNKGFRGVYDFTDRVPFGELFRRFAANPRPNMLIMCHPGYVDEALEKADSLTRQRERELAWLASPAYGETLRLAGLTPRRLAA